MLTGGCHCGAVRYEVRGPVFAPNLCHCDICRGTTGAPCVAWFSVHPTAFVIAAWRFGGPDTPKVEGLNSPPRTQASTAKRVTLSVRAVHGPTFMEVRAGSAAGKPLYTGTLERGQLQRFTKKALYLSLARPGNAAVTVNGNLIVMPRSGRRTFGPAG